MSVLANFPMVSQLTQVTSDGRPSENSAFDCVPASIGAGILWYQGKHAWDQEVNPDHLKDLAYGEGLHDSGTAALAYVDICAKLGIKLWSINGDPAQLVTHAHLYLSLQRPVIFTEKDPYVPSSFGWSHVCVFFADSFGQLTALDPYIGKPVTKSDAEWEQVLLFNQIWILERIEEVVTIDLNTPGVSDYFELVNGNQWKCKQTQKIIHGAILAEYCKYGNAGLAGLTFLGLPKSNEVPIPNASPCVKQYFERGVLVYDPVPHKLDNPPGAGDVYNAQLYNGVGQDPAVSALQKQIADLQAQLTNQQQPNANALSTLKQIKTLVETY